MLLWAKAIPTQRNKLAKIMLSLFSINSLLLILYLVIVCFMPFTWLVLALSFRYLFCLKSPFCFHFATFYQLSRGGGKFLSIFYCSLQKYLIYIKWANKFIKTGLN